VAIAALVVAGGVAAASTPPGTAKQVAALVAAAPKIVSLPARVTPSVAKAGGDTALVKAPSLNVCITGNPSLPACVFGDTHASRTMVLFGDSHAFMWFPAVDAIAKAQRWRLVALISFGCPVSDVTVWNVDTHQAETVCPKFRASMIARINKLDPALVIVTEGFYTIDASQHPITDPEWTAALERSLSALHAPSMKKVVIGNTILIPNPIACLAANPSAIQQCSRSSHNPTLVAQRAAELAGATAAKVPYVDEIRWTCSAVCTVVIGNMIAYNSAGHLSATYATYLTAVLRAALKPEM